MDFHDLAQNHGFGLFFGGFRGVHPGNPCFFTFLDPKQLEKCSPGASGTQKNTFFRYTPVFDPVFGSKMEGWFYYNFPAVLGAKFGVQNTPKTHPKRGVFWKKPRQI